MTEPTTFEPDWVSPPGDTIEDILESKGWTKREFASRIDFSEKHVSQLTSGEASISENTALRLERVLGGSASFWLTRETNYREALARDEAREAFAQQEEWLRELPLTDMRRWGWISRTRDKVQQVSECLNFFGVANVNAWREHYASPLTAFRASGRARMKPGAVAAWIRQTEREAEAIESAPWDQQLFSDHLTKFRELSLETEPDRFMPELVELCARCGVAVVVVPPPKGCPVFGMTRWLHPRKALLALSLRYKSHDQFWFSFFHEAAHLLLHGKKLTFIEGMDGLDETLEEEANEFAARQLIPTTAMAEFRELNFDRSNILDFAEQIQIHPGIVVGRLQRERGVFDRCNDLKVFYKFAK